METTTTPKISTISQPQLAASKSYYQKIVFDILDSDPQDKEIAQHYTNLIAEHIVLNPVSANWKDRQTMKNYYEDILWVSEESTQQLIELFDETKLVEITFNEDIEQYYRDWWSDADWWELLYEAWEKLRTIVPINSYGNINDGHIIVYNDRLWKNIHLRLAHYVLDNKASFSVAA